MNSQLDTGRWLRRAALALTTASLGALAGCALIGSHPIPKPAPLVQAAPPPAPPKPQLAAPIDNHRFVLAHPQDDVVGTVQVTVAAQPDTLSDIARRFNVGFDEIVHANPSVDAWIPGAGTHVVVPTQFVLPDAPHEGIVINVAALRLFYFPKHKPGEPQLVYTYPIGIGKAGWNTPQGVTKVVARVPNPTWRPSMALRRDHFKDNGEALPAVVPPGPDNPLGKFEFRLGWPSYLIHGTDKPYGVGLRSSHGCVRLYPEDIEKLFRMVPVGTPVRVVNQPFVFGWRDGQLYLQAYIVLKDDRRDWQHARKQLLTQMLPRWMRQRLQQAGGQIDWRSVAAIAAEPRGVPVPVTGTSTSAGIDAVLASAPTVQNRIPDGADWNGEDDSGADAKSPGAVLSDLESGSPAATAVRAAPAKSPPVHGT
ncbi:MAG TPA: L,D-transpeptidase family protein [Steroidobacteraceae bacterium]|jgi:L,D-transpeptidase ErfK/SrfK|nr:L,D-transpeptidase family protein [Steroidobacteraceae bacterium]